MKGQLMKVKPQVKNASSANIQKVKEMPSSVAIKLKQFTSVQGAPDANAQANTQRQSAWVYPALLGTAIAVGILLSLCHFPMSWGLLAWVALVPFLFLVRTRAFSLWSYLCAWACGSVFFWITLSWMPASNDMMRIAWYAVSVYCAPYFPIALFLMRLLDRRTRLPLIVSAPVVWVGVDFVRSFMISGFAWYYIGHTQHIFLPVIQIADFGGAYAVSFLIVAVNVASFQWLCTFRPISEFFRLRQPAVESVTLWQKYPLQQTGVVGGLIVMTLIYGYWRLSQNDFQRGPRLALLQGNIDQNIRNKSTNTKQKSAVRTALQQITREYDHLCAYASSYSEGDGVDLIVWPETSFPGGWPIISQDIPIHERPRLWEDGSAKAAEHLRLLTNVEHKTNMLIGINTFCLVNPPNDEVRYNSALLVRKDGTIGDRYDKIHRIPFGEYTPLQEWPFLAQFSPASKLNYGIVAGNKMNRFKLGDHTFGVLICYEDTDPVMARQFSMSKGAGDGFDPFRFLEDLRRRLDGIEQQDGPPVDFLINMSNDGWYAGTSEHNEHLAIARFRAIESRRSIARAVNMGISAVIDPNGRVLKPGHYALPYQRKDGSYVFYWDIEDDFKKLDNLPVSQWNEFKARSGVLTSLIPIDRRTSLYSIWGDWFVYLCCLVVVAGFVWALLPKRNIQTA